MTTILSVDEVRQHVETDLSDMALQQRIAEADALIVRRAGAHTGVVAELHSLAPGAELLFTRRDIDTGESVVVKTIVGGVETTLTVDVDYVIDSVRQVRRIGCAWTPLVRITYTPVSDAAIRKGVLIDLVRLALTYQAVNAESVGDVSVTHADYAREQRRILSRLRSGTGLFA